MFHLFQVLIYQPFLNLLVGIYWLLDLIPTNQWADMGVAVIIFTIIIRILLLPISLAAHRTEKDRRQIQAEIAIAEEKFQNDPVRLREESKRILRRNRPVVAAELVSLTIQVIVALMLWRIFATGLTGEDLHLIYPWMPRIDLPFNLVFLGKWDLTHSHWQLNIIQSILIFILEALSLYVSPYPVSRGEVVRFQLALPLVSFIVFAFLPAGKKLFVITTLLFSIALVAGRALMQKAKEIEARIRKREEAAERKEDALVVEPV